MTEVNLFILVGAIAVVAAVMMLLSENAVHSALFLIVNMGLHRIFLSHAQRTVPGDGANYRLCRAIMVLFLFVIMLLGAENLSGGSTPFRWLTPAAMVLALAFLVIAGLSLGQGHVSDLSPAAGDPQVRIAHFAPDAGVVDLRVSGVVVQEGLAFGDSVGYLSFPPGDYEFALVETGTENALVQQMVTLDVGQIGTAVAFGAESPMISLVDDDLTTTAEDQRPDGIFQRV